MSDSRKGLPRKRPSRIGTAWGVLQIVVAVALLAYSYLRGQDPEVRERRALDRGRAELLQTLPSGNDVYSLRYFGYHAVYKNGKRVFDSREADTRGCIRLRRRDDGGVDLECQHAFRSEAVFLPMP